MRYIDSGAVHLDFYRTLNATIEFISVKYGEEFLLETFRRTARDVYRSIRNGLMAGSSEELVRHWKYYMDREEGKYSIKECDDEIIMTVSTCPAVDYLKKEGIEVSPHFCRQTAEVNRALSDGTPFAIETDVTGPCSCVQSVKRRENP